MPWQRGSWLQGELGVEEPYDEIEATLKILEVL